jgi:hypothetical protein
MRRARAHAAETLLFLCLVALLAAAGASCGGESDEASDTVSATSGPGGGEDDGSADGGDDDSGDESPDDAGNGSDDGSSEDDDDDEPATTNEVQLSDTPLNQRPIDLGSVLVGRSLRATFEIVSLDKARRITKLAVFGEHESDFVITGGDCREGAQLVPDSPCTLELTFTPSGRGTRRAVLDVEVDRPLSRELALEGHGGIDVVPDVDETLTQPTEDSSNAP